VKFIYGNKSSRAQNLEPGWFVVPDNFMSVHRDLIISLTAQFRIPAIYRYRYFAEAGASRRTACMP